MAAHSVAHSPSLYLAAHRRLKATHRGSAASGATLWSSHPTSFHNSSSVARSTDSMATRAASSSVPGGGSASAVAEEHPSPAATTCPVGPLPAFVATFLRAILAFGTPTSTMSSLGILMSSASQTARPAAHLLFDDGITTSSPRLPFEHTVFKSTAEPATWRAPSK